MTSDEKLECCSRLGYYYSVLSVSNMLTSDDVTVSAFRESGQDKKKQETFR